MEKTNEIKFQECLEKAKALVECYKHHYAPESIIKDSPINGASAPGAQDESGVLSAYQHYLPSILSEIGAAIPGMANQQAEAAISTQPEYNQSNLQQLQEFGLPMTNLSNEITYAQAKGGAATNLGLLTGNGGKAATAAQNLNEELNPNYYNDIGAASRGVQTELANINLSGLSPGEEAAVERSTNRGNAATGNLGLDNGTNIIANAMNFGGAFNSKLGVLNNAAGTASNIAGVASGNGGFNPVSVALGAPSFNGSSFGTSMFNPVNPSTASTATSPVSEGASSLLGQMGQQNVAETSGMYQNKVANAMPNYMPNISC